MTVTLFESNAGDEVEVVERESVEVEVEGVDWELRAGARKEGAPWVAIWSEGVGVVVVVEGEEAREEEVEGDCEESRPWGWNNLLKNPI